MKNVRTIRQSENKRAISPRRKTVCSCCSWFTLISPLGLFNTSHPPKGKIRETREAWTMKHFSAPFPASPIPLPQTPWGQERLPCFMKFQIILRGMSEWLHWPTDSICMGSWGRQDRTQSSPLCWGRHKRVPLSAEGMWNWNNSSWECSKPHHLHEIYSVGSATKPTGFDLGELLNHVWLKNSLQRIISAFWVNEKPARRIYGSKRPSIRGREKKS